MRQGWVLWLFLFVVACREKAPAGGAVRVSVQYGSYTPACLRVLVRDAQGHEAGTDILQSHFQKREANEILIAVFRKPDWGRALTLEVSSYDSSSGEACSGNRVETYSTPEPIPVPLGDFARFDATLRAQDADGDTFIQPAEGVLGTDCDDQRGDVHPGAPEQCSVLVDFDCDGAKGCQDSRCQDQACDDGNACTTGDHCQGSGTTAVCSGQAVQCEQPTGVCFTGAACDPGTGQCVNAKAPPETPCNDNDPCTVNDQCGPEARCAGMPKSCNTPPSLCSESPGTCNAATGNCDYAPKPASASCDDAVACTVSDMCDGTGACHGVQTPCSPSNSCRRVTGGCTALGNCAEEPDPSKVNASCAMDASRTGVCRAPDGACSTFPYAPSNFDPDAIAAASIVPLTITCAVTFDSGALTWTPSSCVSNPPQPQVLTQGSERVLLPVSSLSLGADLRLVGTRPVILAVYGDATLDHNILANGAISGTETTPGAGGNQVCGTRRGSDGLFSNGAGGGGGGAGGGTAGAAGNKGTDADSTGGGFGNAGGSGFVPLVGGCPGGSGGGGSNVAGKGGAGGGAIQLSVARTLTVNQLISASGSGGLGAKNIPNQAGGGGGGGSGGQVLLEAHHLIIASSGRLTANGGGGGEGAGYLDASNNSNGANGQDGSTSSATQAGGGSGGSTSGGAGGAGGAGVSPPGAGAAGTSVIGSKGGGGGGGGAVGYIRLRSVQPCTLNSSGVISPATDTQCPL